MRLAEALLERADLQKRIEALQSRIIANASHQEGEEPSEDAADLLEQALRAIDSHERLVVAINLTNSVVAAADGSTLTSLLARRETLRSRHTVLVRAADAAGVTHGIRQLRSELRQVSALPVKQLRERADAVAEELRALDAAIQRTNWEVELNES